MFLVIECANCKFCSEIYYIREFGVISRKSVKSPTYSCLTISNPIIEIESTWETFRETEGNNTPKIWQWEEKLVWT